MPFSIAKCLGPYTASMYESNSALDDAIQFTSVDPTLMHVTAIDIYGNSATD